MNDTFEPRGAFERRRSNRAVLMVVAMTLGGIALNEGIHSSIPPAGMTPAGMTPAGDSRPQVKRLIPEADRKPRTDAIATWTQPRNDHSAGIASPHPDPCDEIR